MNRAQSDFARVYDEHVWPIYGFLAYRVGDHHVAEDLTQATFERALRHWSHFDRRRSSERTWLLSIARNLSIDHHRQGRRRLSEEFDELQAPTVPGPEERVGTAAELTDALGSLSERDREVVALRYGADLTGPEIASVLGLTLANVQQILSRSLRKLRDLLEHPTGSVLEPSRGAEGRQQDQH
jgi:RNA polymerase sigma-70 factor (ECF subfamily)